MKKLLFFIVTGVFLFLSTALFGEDYIVYTAHQSFDSRIYLMHMDGSIHTYYDYSNVRLCGLEVVNNEVYVAEAFCPLVYKLDVHTGNLETIIFDISLYYLYDVCFDGTYFYVDEWDLNRYDINGNKDGTANFDEYVLGAAWNGEHYWTLNDTNEIRCWDISGWPTITEVPSNNFTPPTPDCRGLWFDGQYFWTSESIANTLGHIYKFDYSGTVIDQWLEPAYRGWGACVIDLVGVEENPSAAKGKEKLEFISVSPNPVRRYVNITFMHAYPGRLRLTVYNVLGQRVITLVDGIACAGMQSVIWSGTDNTGERVSPGVYIIKLESGGKVHSQKVMVVN